MKTGLESVDALPKVMAIKWRGHCPSLGLSDRTVEWFHYSVIYAFYFWFCGGPSEGTSTMKMKCLWLVLTLIWDIGVLCSYGVVEARLLHCIKHTLCSREIMSSGVVQGRGSADKIFLWLWRLQKGKWKWDREEASEGHLFELLVLFLKNGPDASLSQNSKPLEFAQRQIYL